MNDVVENNLYGDGGENGKIIKDLKLVGIGVAGVILAPTLVVSGLVIGKSSMSALENGVTERGRRILGCVINEFRKNNKNNLN